MVFQCLNIRQVPWEVLKTAVFDLGFQHLSRDLANVNAVKTMFDPYTDVSNQTTDSPGRSIVSKCRLGKLNGNCTVLFNP